MSRVPPSVVQCLSIQCSHLKEAKYMVQALESSEWHCQILKAIEPSLLTERFRHCFMKQYTEFWRLATETAAARPIAIANFLLQSGSFKKRKLKAVADHWICSLSLKVPLSVSVKWIHLYLSACICSTKEHNLRALSGQLNRQSQVFKPSQHSRGAVYEGGLQLYRGKKSMRSI